MKILEYKLPSTKSSKKRILTISDLHVDNENDLLKLSRIVNSIASSEVQYDAIIIAGDIIDSTNVLRRNKNVTENLIRFMEYLGSIAPVYIAYASHDLAFYSEKIKVVTGQPWCSDESVFKMYFLERIAGYHNINLLSNGTDDLGDGYTLSIFNPSLEYAMLKPDGDDEVLFRESEKFKFLEILSPNNMNIIACHYPNALISLYQKGYLTNIDLGIAGHNHSCVTQFAPLELALKIINRPNQGLITPGKSIDIDNTKYSRDLISLDDRTNLIINPSITTFAKCSGVLNNLDGLFYEGASDIEFIPNSEYQRVRKK